MKKRVFAMLIAFMFVLQMGCFTAFAEGSAVVTLTPAYDQYGNDISTVKVVGSGYEGENSVRAYYNASGETGVAPAAFDYTDSIDGSIDNLDQFNGAFEWTFPSRFDWDYGTYISVFVNNAKEDKAAAVPTYTIADGSSINFKTKEIKYNISNYGLVKDGDAIIEVRRYPQKPEANPAGAEEVEIAPAVVDHDKAFEVLWSSDIINGGFDAQVSAPSMWLGTEELWLNRLDPAGEDICIYSPNGSDDEPIDIEPKPFTVDITLFDENAQTIGYTVKDYNRSRDGQLVLAVVNNGAELARINITKDIVVESVVLSKEKWVPESVEIRLLNLDDETYSILAQKAISAPATVEVSSLTILPKTLTTRVGGSGTLTANPLVDGAVYSWTIDGATSSPYITLTPDFNGNTCKYAAKKAGTAVVSVTVTNASGAVVPGKLTIKITP